MANSLSGKLQNQIQIKSMTAVNPAVLGGQILLPMTQQAGFFYRSMTCVERASVQ
jgi:hypothetical protein